MTKLQITLPGRGWIRASGATVWTKKKPPRMTVRKRRTVDEFKATLAAQRKNTRDTLNALPVRIDEQDKTILALGNADYDALRAQETARTVERLALQSP